ncbi:MAG TPA: hypothetical protein VJ912_02800 [Candidatus Nanoarchaeia archaeon]|nr:hypothetical protein [Candidatus Nanoarchaeia archaeon]
MGCRNKKECEDCMKYRKKINAPTMAYKTVYGEYPEEPIRGRTNYPKKTWKGIDVDENLKEEWLEKLNSLDVEIKSTEEGKGGERVAFVIFRMPKDKDNLYKKVEENLKQEEDLYVSSDFGLENRPRICVAKDIKVGDPGWEKWWSSLPEKIERAYKKAVKSE